MADTWPIGSDAVETVTGLSAGGGYLNAATVTYAVTTLAGAAVAGGTGSYSYTAASSGDYTAVLESTFTSTLTEGEEYLLTVTVVSGAYNRTEYLKRRAVKQFAPIATLAAWKARTGTTTTDAARDAAVSQYLRDADAAVRRAVKPFLPTPATITDLILDAPPRPALALPCVPVRSITSLYLRWGADGDPAAFTAEDLLTNYTQYYLPLDTQPENYSRSGLVYRRGSSSWAFEQTRAPGRLGYRVDPARGAIKVTFAAGPASVPEDLALVVCTAATLLYNRRTHGMPVTSESWNGYSYSLAAPFLTAFLESPDVRSVLLRYQQGFVGVA